MRRLVLAPTLLTLAAACIDHDPAARNDSIIAQGDSDYARSHRVTMQMDSVNTPVKAAPPAALNDSNIAALAANSDQLEIEVARMAVAKASRGDVKYYARQLIDDHARNQRDLRALEKRVGIVERTPPQDTTRQALDHLRKRFGALPQGLTFDTAFVHHEVEDHVHDFAQTKELAARARNADLKKHLTESLSDLQRHLDRARLLSRSLGTKK